MAYPSRPPPPPPAPAQSMGSTNMVFNTEMRFDPSYFKTQEGVLRAVLLTFNIIGIICIASSPFRSNPRGVFFFMVAFLGLVYTSCILYAYVYHAVEKYHNWMWLKVVMFVCLPLVFLNMIASTIVVAFGSAGFSAAGFFGYLCMTLYGLEAFLSARAIKSGAPAQGRVLSTKQQHVLPSPGTTA